MCSLLYVTNRFDTYMQIDHIKADITSNIIFNPWYVYSNLYISNWLHNHNKCLHSTACISVSPVLMQRKPRAPGMESPAAALYCHQGALGKA